MRSDGRTRASLILALGMVSSVGFGVAGCTGSPTAPVASSAVVAAATAAATSAASPKASAKAPAPTAKPAVSAGPAATAVGTTQTAWGRILDAVPDAFPVFPDATLADAPPNGAVSGAWVAKASVNEVVTWYRDALQAANFAKVDLGSALEDGSRVLDAQGDLPECKAQVTVGPAGNTTMITVLVGAGCAGGSG